MQRRRQVLATLAGASALALSGCSGDGSDGGTDGSSDGGADSDGNGRTSTPGSTGEESGSGSGSVSAAWVYIGLTDHVGWTQQHDKGRQHVEEKFDYRDFPRRGGP